MYTVEKDFHANKISFETGRVAKQASGAVLVRSGESVVLVTASLGDERDGDFLPLTIDYVEKTYAAGKIPGGFLKREGRLSERETLISRFIDRPCRPLFPKGFRCEVQVTATVLSADPEVDTDVLALCGASAALTVSEIPFEGPIAGVRVARIDGELVINPTPEKQEKADINYIVAGSKDAIVMVEGGSKEASEKEVLEALFFAHQELQTIIAMQDELHEKAGKDKISFEPYQIDEDLREKVVKLATPKISEAIVVKDKLERKTALKAASKAVIEELVDPDKEEACQLESDIKSVLEDVVYTVVRELIFKTGKRIDGRDNKTVRQIDSEVGFLPRTHGSALFTRGETQAIVTATLGVEQDSQRIDDLQGDRFKYFMLHYNFPPFCVGETRPLRGPGRREIGHGALAERAVTAVLPPFEKWPYSIRVVSEITESNGSSSMATVCGSSLSLMDAGVPLKAPVAGVAMGLMKEGDDCVVLTDILGDEDHLGDMDFKVCGTEAGITALQMDIKIKGLSQEIMTQALDQAKEARLHILSKMSEAISEPRKVISEHAPKIITFKIPTDKIRDLIGPGGKVIKGIQETWDVKINIDDDGTVAVSGNNGKSLDSAVEICKSLTEKAEVGKLYKGVVKRIADFGAFVEILPGVDGLVHISQLDEDRVERVTDIVQEGDEIWVKVLEVDRQGKIRLSLKDAIAEMADN